MSDRDRIAAISHCTRWHHPDQPHDKYECKRPPTAWDYELADALIAAGVTMPSPPSARTPMEIATERITRMFALIDVPPLDSDDWPIGQVTA